MIVDVAARYKAMVRKRNAREFREQRFGCVVPVIVRELTHGEAPVAIRLDVPVDVHSHHERRALRPMELREVEGRLFGSVEAVGCTGVLPGVTCDAAWLAKVSAADDRLSDGPFRELMGGFNVDPAPRIEEARISAVESSGMVDVVAQVHRRAADLVLVDGVLWRAVEEPRLVISFVDAADLNVIEGRVIFGRPIQRDKVEPSAVYRLDDVDLACRRQQYVVDNLGYVVEMPRIEILRPGLLHLDANGEYLAHAAGKTLALMGKDLHLRPLSYMTAFANLRDALPSFETGIREGGETDHAPFIDLMDASHAARVEVEGPNRTHDDVAAAIERWRLAGDVPEDVASLTF